MKPKHPVFQRLAESDSGPMPASQHWLPVSPSVADSAGSLGFLQLPGNAVFFQLALFLLGLFLLPEIHFSSSPCRENSSFSKIQPQMAHPGVFSSDKEESTPLSSLPLLNLAVSLWQRNFLHWCHCLLLQTLPNHVQFFSVSVPGKISVWLTIKWSCKTVMEERGPHALNPVIKGLSAFAMQRVQVVGCSPLSPKLMAPQCSLIPWMEGAIPLTWSMGHQEWSASSPSTTQSVLGPVDLASQMSLKFIYFLSALPTAFTNLPSSVTVEHCLAHGWGPIYRSVFFFNLFKLEDNCFTILYWFLPYINMNQP